METFLSASPTLKASTSIFNACEQAFNMMNAGKDVEAKQQYPLEYYLIKKYMQKNFEFFRNLLRERMELK